MDKDNALGLALSSSTCHLGVASELQSVSRRDCKKIGQSTIGGLLTYYMCKYNY